MYSHVVLGGNAPRWQPLSGIQLHTMVKHQLKSALAGDGGDGSRQQAAVAAHVFLLWGPLAVATAAGT
jgi:hypothetical protein